MKKMRKFYFVLLLLIVVCCGVKEPEAKNDKAKSINGDIFLEHIVWKDTHEESGINKDKFTDAVKSGLQSKISPNEKSKHCRVKVNGSYFLQERKVLQESEGSVLIELKYECDDFVLPLNVFVQGTSVIKNKSDNEMLVKKVLNDSIFALTSMIRLYNGGENFWLRALNAPEPDEQILGIKLLAHQKSVEFTLPICKLLDDSRVQVVETAAEALGQIGDERAVSLLIASVKPNDIRSEVRCIEAISRIGGSEARAYLEMIALGHGLEEIRNIASRALKLIK